MQSANSNFPQPGNIGKLFSKKVLWNLRGSVWELPLKANASYWRKWWRMISRCASACFGNCGRKWKRVAGTTENDVKHRSMRDWAYTSKTFRIQRGDSGGVSEWRKRWSELSENRCASMLACTPAHYFSTLCSLSYALSHNHQRYDSNHGNYARLISCQGL